MKKYFVAGFLILGLLLLGCTTPNQPAANTSSGSSSSGGTGSSSSSSGGTGSSSSSSSGGAGGLDLAGLGYAQLVGLGVPIQCQFTDTQDGISTSLTMKIRGNRAMGQGTVTANGTTTNTVFISLPDAMYVQLSPDERTGILANCEWMKVATSGANFSGTNVNGVETNPAGDLGSATAKYDCVPGVFGDDVFTPPANACDLNELINNAVNASGNNMPDPCDSIQNDAQKTACKAACGTVPNFMEKVQCAASYMGG